MVDISNMSAADRAALKQQLRKQEEREKKASKRLKAQWEEDRDKLSKVLCMLTEGISNGLMRIDLAESELKDEALHVLNFEGLKGFKAFAFAKTDEMQLRLIDLNQGSKNLNNYFLRSTDEKYKVDISTQIKPVYDESFQMGIEKIHEWLNSTVKKASKEVAVIVERLLAKNKDGQYNANKILELIGLKEQINNELFSKGCDIIAEAWKAGESNRYIRFYIKEEYGYRNISLQFSAL